VDEDELEARIHRALFAASLSLLTFGVFTAIAVVGWFATSPDPWSWPGLVAIGATLGALVTSAKMWRDPSREAVAIGICVMLFSLLRVGPFPSWGGTTIALVGLTALLMAPLVFALVLLSRP